MDKEKINEILCELKDNIKKIVVGNDNTIDMVITAMLAGGHILIEDNPGTGKTMLAKAVAKSISGDFKRVQFTPDLMPSDITGLNVFNQKETEFKLVKGPVFTNIFLADEINRATPRTQSSLLEAMEEKQVTIDGNTLTLSDVFTVIATENPLETIGTYPLPEAQLDRFIMKLAMGDIKKEEELEVIDRYINRVPLEEINPVCSVDDISQMKKEVCNVYIDKCIREYIVEIILATRNSNKLTAGVSTRGTLALVRCSQAYAMLKNKDYVEPDDIRTVAPFVLGHRIVTISGSSNFKTGKDIIKDIVGNVDVPTENWGK